MKTLLFKIFAPLRSPRKLVSFAGVVVVLSVGIGVFWMIQILLSNYNRSIVDKVMESREEIVVFRDPTKNKTGKEKKLSFHARSRIGADEESALADRIRSILPDAAVSPFVKTDDIAFVYEDGGATFQMRAALLIGADFDRGRATLPVLDQADDSARNDFGRAGTKIPLMISEGLLPSSVIEGRSFDFEFEGKKYQAEIVAVLEQNKLFPIPIVVAPLAEAKKMLGRTSSDGIGVRTFDDEHSLALAESLESFLGGEFIVNHWSESLSMLDGIFKAVNVIISVIVSSLFVLAFFFAVVTFDVLLKRKQEQLAVLLALGMPPKVIRVGLLRLGGAIGLFCLFCGCGLAFLFLNLLPFTPLAAIFDVMMVDDFSFRLESGTLFVVALIAVCVPLFSAWFASKRAFKIDPIEDLRK